MIQGVVQCVRSSELIYNQLIPALSEETSPHLKPKS